MSFKLSPPGEEPGKVVAGYHSYYAVILVYYRKGGDAVSVEFPCCELYGLVGLR
jgi:hypothetical protein